jgi:hypothetical protein
MANILITGMTSSQASSRLGRKSTSFSALLERALLSRGHTVAWEPASVKWDLDYLSQYDSVLVGVAPVTSLSANYAYGALAVMYQLLGDKRLALFVDAPHPRQVTAALRAVEPDPEALFKPFYKNRREYELVQGDAALMTYIYGSVRALLTEDWPPTLYPTLPWKTDDQELKKALPGGATAALVGLNLDSLIAPVTAPTEAPAGDRWVVDTPKTKWAQSTISMLLLPVTPAKWHKGWTDAQVENNMRQAVGVLVTPHKPGGTWWTPRYMQALNSRVPVATDWKESAFLGSQWNVLAATIEAMESAERATLSDTQRELYLQHIPNKTEAARALERALKLKTGKTSK